VYGSPSYWSTRNSRPSWRGPYIVTPAPFVRGATALTFSRLMLILVSDTTSPVIVVSLLAVCCLLQLKLWPVRTLPRIDLDTQRTEP